MEVHKGIVIAVIVFFVVIMAYNFLAPNTSATMPDIVTTGPGAEVVSLKSNLESINFDQSLFSSLPFESLTDFSSPLPTETVGRLNPFDPL